MDRILAPWRIAVIVAAFMLAGAVALAASSPTVRELDKVAAVRAPSGVEGWAASIAPPDVQMGAVPAPAPEPEPVVPVEVPAPEPEPVPVVEPSPRVTPAPIVQTSGWPRGCTVPGTFDPGPCIPKGTGCVLPDFICNREASSINIWNLGGSGASGKYQFMPGTWNGYGGYQFAADAPESIQDAKAVEVWAGGRGCSHWSACG